VGALDAEQLAFELYASALGFPQFPRLLDDPAAEERCRRAFDAAIARVERRPPPQASPPSRPAPRRAATSPPHRRGPTAEARRAHPLGGEATHESARRTP